MKQLYAIALCSSSLLFFLLGLFFFVKTTCSLDPTDNRQFVTVRLEPGEDLKAYFEKYAKEDKVPSAFVVTCVGSLDKAILRMAGAKEIKEFEGPLEIVSLVGTFGKDGLHMHLSLSDKNGRVVGGHLMPGCIVHTTAEIVFVIDPDVAYKRELCHKSGWPELKVKKNNHSS